MLKSILDNEGDKRRMLRISWTTKMTNEGVVKVCWTTEMTNEKVLTAKMKNE